MDKELPASGRSAFTVFGFGTDRYANFDSPLETPANIESFNATDSIAFPSRPTLKSKKQASLTDGSGEACKMRLGAGPDSSRLVLQSLLPGSSVSAGFSVGESHIATTSISAKGLERVGAGGRRYSGDQASQAGEGAEIMGIHSHTDQLLQMFSSTLQVQSSPSKGAGRQPGLEALSETGTMSGNVQPGALSSTGGMRRQGSTPVLSSLAHQTGNLVQGYLKRRSSSSALYSLSESGGNNTVATTSQDPPSSDTTDTEATTSGALELAGAITPAVPKTFPADSSVDSTDAPSTKSKGFGLLNRTRRFGAWLGKVTHGEKMEVSKKDLNVFAPTSF